MEISYDDFAKLDIRIGIITAVAAVPETDKLLQLTVDVGEPESRQIISGIKHFFEDSSELEGMKVPVLVNLAPRTIRGLESQGMILAVGDNDTFAMLTPCLNVPPGTPVR